MKIENTEAHALLAGARDAKTLEIVAERLRERSRVMRSTAPLCVFAHEEQAATGEADGLDDAAGEIDAWAKEVAER